MPELDAGGGPLHYELSGAGPETILFLHSLFLSGAMWRGQLAAFEPTHRCMTLDFRGQGSSPVVADGYDMETLYADVVAVIGQVGAPVHLVGAAMGGYVALRVAARQPALLRSLTLIGTSAEPEPADRIFQYRLMAQIGKLAGFRLIVDRLMGLLFGPSFLADPAQANCRATWRSRLLANNARGMARALAGALERRDVSEELYRIKAPTLIMVGEEDAVNTPVRSERMHEAIRGSRLVVVPDAGHALPVEQPDVVNKALRSFLNVDAGVV